jgi:hypothetical protein
MNSSHLRPRSPLLAGEMLEVGQGENGFALPGDGNVADSDLMDWVPTDQHDTELPAARRQSDNYRMHRPTERQAPRDCHPFRPGQKIGSRGGSRKSSGRPLHRLITERLPPGRRPFRTGQEIAWRSGSRK